MMSYSAQSRKALQKAELFPNRKEAIEEAQHLHAEIPGVPGGMQTLVLLLQENSLTHSLNSVNAYPGSGSQWIRRLEPGTLETAMLPAAP